MLARGVERSQLPQQAAEKESAFPHQFIDPRCKSIFHTKSHTAGAGFTDGWHKIVAQTVADKQAHEAPKGREAKWVSNEFTLQNPRRSQIGMGLQKSINCAEIAREELCNVNIPTLTSAIGFWHTVVVWKLLICIESEPAFMKPVSFDWYFYNTMRLCSESPCLFNHYYLHFCFTELIQTHNKKVS